MMTKTAHTPGPWQLRHERFNRTTVAGQNGALIASVHVVESTEHREANARLIAAAPELLDVLKEAQVRVFMADGSSELYHRIHTVLNAAKGDKP